MTVQKKIRELVKTGNLKEKKKGASILERFIGANEKQKRLIDEIFIEICGASFTQMIEEIKKEKRGN